MFHEMVKDFFPLFDHALSWYKLLKLDFVYNEIEKNLQLAGATAIEDKLQVGHLLFT